MLLEVKNLSITLPLENGLNLHAVRNVSFQIERGECLGVVGESGSGKSLTALSIPRLLPRRAQCSADTLRINRLDLTAMSERELASTVRGTQVGYIFQEPMTALNPVYSIGRQLIETMRRHQAVTTEHARERAIELLERVGIASPAKRLTSFPHEFSGGQRQRIMIAMALMNRPHLLIADEPTTALDVTVQKQILDLLDGLRRELGMGLLLISHNLGAVASVADNVAVMYAGEIVEAAPTHTLFTASRHPYTQGLLQSIPDLGKHEAGTLLPTLPGTVQSFYSQPSSCVFERRCNYAFSRCGLEAPKLRTYDRRHTGACHLANPPQPEEVETPKTMLRRPAGDVLLEAKDISMAYSVRAGLFKPRLSLKAVVDVSLRLRKGRTLAIVGESGCGKSTLARILLGLEQPVSGDVLLDGRPIGAYEPAQRAALVQTVFQDPYSSLNPSRRVSEIVRRPLDLSAAMPAAQRDAHVTSLLEKVGLPTRLHHASPGQLSGGQRQRVAIARALATNPALIVCDEPTSALDVSVQAQILNLLLQLRSEFLLTLVFISHDLAVVGHMADEIAVMYLGEVVEYGPAAEILANPVHPYTKALLASTPSLAQRTQDESNGILPGVANPMQRPEGCCFSPRCPYRSGACGDRPALRAHGSGRTVRCHFASSLLGGSSTGEPMHSRNDMGMESMTLRA
ncbi:putative peptide transport fused subunits of ABC superfamily: ATP-binding components [Cupriavidus taiwanensis]|uniref:dipeptide ABC transporter ATP-binding protein n=1 Tax=Cupriavidus taiwanensis TaxID=164546 RepID=UPI000E13EDC4|nr:ABC transporter ATP-binding protein [Cupriavidus taiwanensis]SPA02645.1 putative peptide transport fused subunits of ABC superfamily: ATP-binding components [Cupriavidus taiwanensis]